jgi:hypothetical protein
MTQPQTQYKIVQTVALKTMPNPALARELLERLVLVTAKVVEKRRWRVPVLKEFYPKNKGLLGLNVNRGQSIMIRLREGSDQFSFLPWHSVLGTLVHELTHNVVGEHSAEFYEMMDKVYDEVENTYVFVCMCVYVYVFVTFNPLLCTYYLHEPLSSAWVIHLYTYIGRGIQRRQRVLSQSALSLFATTAQVHI